MHKPEGHTPGETREAREAHEARDPRNPLTPSSAPAPTPSAFPHRTLLRGLAAAGALTLALTGCGLLNGNDSGDGDEEGENGDASGGGGAQEAIELPVSSETTSTEYGSDLQVEIQALERIDDDLLRLSIGVGNDTPEDIRNFDHLRDRDYGRYDASGATLLDPGSDSQHMPMTVSGSDGECYCSELEDRTAGAGIVEPLWVVFPAPSEDVEAMTVTTPITGPFHGVPITDADDAGDIDVPDLDDPVVHELLHETDQTVEGYQRYETDDDVTYELASDVLFDTESADLGDEAEETLTDVASEIDSVEPDSVTIDGHTDNTGDDSVNEPLSLERAEAVETALTGLVGADVDYAVDGHGSADPVADNDTDAGQEQNRRVTVSFEK
ncbi:OmpA family protein [Nocardiopsis sp. HNM0947]|uniref:OmpA family protein n=1 Tax=Nocardiopsis coralli TaxID=2772213 RepID=A0ABR9PA70_9ACTN|nr:OmpA family protein [Nocardiopsis coralli]MBE3000726.1 OmpA family protein [Nocardiopsis coralli]